MARPAVLPLITGAGLTPPTGILGIGGIGTTGPGVFAASPNWNRFRWASAYFHALHLGQQIQPQRGVHFHWIDRISVDELGFHRSRRPCNLFLRAAMPRVIRGAGRNRCRRRSRSDRSRGASRRSCWNRTKTRCSRVSSRPPAPTRPEARCALRSAPNFIWRLRYRHERMCSLLVSPPSVLPPGCGVADELVDDQEARTAVEQIDRTSAGSDRPFEAEPSWSSC